VRYMGEGFPFTPLEIMPRYSAAGLDFRIIPAGLVPQWNF
jgi:hypothetical protein